MDDALIIGAGPAGIEAALRIAQLGGSATLIERDLPGGVCTNWGCIPTKAMLAPAKLARAIREGAAFGVHADPIIRFKQVIAHRDRAIAWSRSFAEQSLEAAKIPIITGEARIIDEKTIAIGRKRLRAKAIIIATGSEPIVPAAFTLSADVLTSKQLLAITTLPKRLVIIGGGVIGCEFASIFASLGSHVTIIEMAERLVPGEDAMVSRELAKAFTSQGITIELASRAERITSKAVITPKGEHAYSKVLIAIGRRPAVSDELLGSVPIKHDARGIAVDAQMRTSSKSIYAIGDATGKSALAHAGQRQGIVAANTIMGVRDAMRYDVPHCIYSIPEAASIGKQQGEVQGARIGIAPLRYNARAVVEGASAGFVKVVLDGERIVGVHMVGEHVTELVNEASLLVSRRIKACDVLSTIHAHPTLGEAIRDAVRMAARR